MFVYHIDFRMFDNIYCRSQDGILNKQRKETKMHLFIFAEMQIHRQILTLDRISILLRN